MTKRRGRLVDSAQRLQRITEHDPCRHMGRRQLEGPLKRRKRIFWPSLGFQRLAKIEPGRCETWIKQRRLLENPNRSFNITACPQ